MQLAKVIFIDNETLNQGIMKVNRCYSWAQLKEHEVGAQLEKESNYAEDNSEENAIILNDFYNGKGALKLT